MINSAKLSSGGGDLDFQMDSNMAFDLMLHENQANPWWWGATQLYLSCPSRNLYNVYLGQVELTGKRLGIYETYTFEIPADALRALVNASYNDLHFTVVLNVPYNNTGVYRIDNLRVKNPAAPVDPDNPPEGGESQKISAWREYVPSSEGVGDITFPMAAIQIPKDLRAVKGNAGNGQAVLELGVAGVNEITCSYVGDATTGGVYYTLNSCDGPETAGDLISADFARLNLVSGDPSAGKTKIFAQLAQNPVGDEIGAKIPPLPTYWGRTPEETTVILQEMIEEHHAVPLTEDVVVNLPSPAFTPQPWVNEGMGAPDFNPDLDVDPPFGLSQGLTGSWYADAVWYMNGYLGAGFDQMTGSRWVQLSTNSGIDLVIFGNYINLLGVSGEVISSSSSDAIDSHAQFCFDTLLISEQCPVDEYGHVSLNHSIINQSFSFPLIPPQNWWVFSLNVDGVLYAGASVQGALTENGASVSLTPTFTASVEIRGGVSAGPFGGGGLYGDIDLIDVNMPVTFGVTADISTAPGNCNLTIQESFAATANVSAGGGEIGWYLRGGVTCGIWSGGCWEHRETLLPWGGMASTPIPIYPETPVGTQVFPLAGTLCNNDINVWISHPVDGATFLDGSTSYLQGEAYRSWADSSVSNGWGLGFPECSAYNWSSSNPADVIVPAVGSCDPDITYNGAGQRIITLTVQDQYGAGTHSKVVNVGAVAQGSPTVQIVQPAGNWNYTGCWEDVTFVAEGTDPDGQELTYDWYLTNVTGGDDYYVGSGQSVTFWQQSGYEVYVVATDPDGNVGYDETYMLWICVF